MSRRSDSAERGFTLIEMIVVIAVMAIAVAMLEQIGRRPGDTTRMRAADREIADTLRLARSQAVMENRRVAVVFDVASGSWYLAPGPRRSLPDGVRARLLTTRGEVADPTLGRIGFRPDGSSSGGRLTLDGNAMTMAIGVDWLSGRVSIAEIR
jgi:general secretion pathway protein H